MSEADPRPRPQYGEYATAEEQRARIARPDVTDALATGTSIAPPAQAPRATPPAPARRRAVDRVVTIGLLVYGFFNVVFTAPRLFDFASFANDYLALMGVEAEFSNHAAAQVWGPVAGIVYVAGWVGTAILSWWRLRRGGMAFWIPLVGAVVTTMLVALCLTVPLVGDPSFAGVIENLSPGS